jgi:cobaltochelatase CobT
MIDWRRLFAQPDRQVSDGPADEPYRVYTRVHDLELLAADLPDQLVTASPDKREWRDKDGSGWRDALDLANRFADAQTPADAAIRSHLGSEAAHFAVSLLIDQSGSMKGEPIAATAVAVRAFEASLSAAGVRTEILGFSTAGWHGGYARAAWLREGRPPRPGRLCSLLHIVYKSADESSWPPPSRDAMLHPDLLRENVDGEALEWASARLAAVPARHKLLIILSDGAPVDDSTLTENGPSYLERSLFEAIAKIEKDETITFGALGIGHAVDRYYRHSRSTGIETLLHELTELFGSLATLSRASKS